MTGPTRCTCRPTPRSPGTTRWCLTQPPALEPFLSEVRAYSMGRSPTALLKGDALTDAERDAVAEKMHEYTGLSVEYLKDANLRVSEIAFAHELLKPRQA